MYRSLSFVVVVVAVAVEPLSERYSDGIGISGGSRLSVSTDRERNGSSRRRSTHHLQRGRWNSISLLSFSSLIRVQGYSRRS